MTAPSLPSEATGDAPERKALLAEIDRSCRTPLMLLFLGWWGGRAFAIWRSPDAAEMARAACIASAAILLHSLVDYPLRTAAIATSMAMVLALMADPARRRHQARAADLRPTRHLTL